ncbi:MAG: hypothetical protein KC910_26320 [Candidatus Eremiobacteraeota bacterium]|nr:hypothetical protein [Candidatus Eremiobacteraeota bacterium]
MRINNVSTPPTYARAAAQQQPPAQQPPQDTVEPARPRLLKKVGITALGGGSVGGAVGFVVDLATGKGFGGPAWALGVTIGLGAGALLGVGGYFAAKNAQS